MRRLIMFLTGLLLLALTVAMVFLTSAIYDTTAKESFITYFFQTNGWSVMRPGAPISVADISETAMREMLIKKYVTEYFYVVPDMDNITRRMGAKSTLSKMSDPKVFNEWKQGEAIGIQDMAKNNMMRTVEISGEIFKPDDSDYWIVPYVLKTWSVPNDMSLDPQITYGTLLISISFKPGFRESFDIGQHLKDSYNGLESGIDPAVIFRFGVKDLERR